MIHDDRKFVGEVVTRNSDVSDDKNRRKHSAKNHRHTKNHYSLHTETHPVPWTQTYTINHNTASSWDYSNQPHCSTYKLLSITMARYSFPTGIWN